MKKTFVRCFLVFTLLICLLLPAAALAAGDEPAAPEPSLGEIVLSEERLALPAAETHQFAAGAADGSDLPQLVWTSSDPEVASVDAEGMLTALKRGSVKITVTAADGSTDSAVCKVTVKKSKVVPIKATLEGNVYDGNYTHVSAETEIAVRAYCERLGSSRGEKMMRKAAEYVGTPYSKLDCSKFARAVCRTGGIRLPRVSDDQAMKMLRYAREDGVPQIGDVFFMQVPEGEACSCGGACRRFARIHHVALYLGEIDGNSYVIDSSSTLGCVVIRQFSSGYIADMPVVFVAGK